MTRNTIVIVCLIWLGMWTGALANPVELTQGDQGSAVTQLQQELKRNGVFSGPVSGVFDEATYEAVLAFQKRSGLAADGVVGPQTQRALRYYGQPANTSRQLSYAGRRIVSQALSFLGTPYVWAGISPSGFDCSGFTYYLYGQQQISIPRMADGQYYAGSQVDLRQIREGDLVFFTTYEPGPSHVGIYIGNGNFVHASSAAGKVVITSLSAPYYQNRFLGARRFF